MSHAAAVERLRRISKTVEASLPRDVRRVIEGVQIHIGALGLFDGQRVEGLASKNGAHVVIDRAFVEHGDEPAIEATLAHELAHIYRTRTGQHDEDELREEKETIRVVKSWGFRSRQQR